MINSVGSFLFDSIKPMILSEAEARVRHELNNQARSMPQRFPNSITPVDMFLVSARCVIKKTQRQQYKRKKYHEIVLKKCIIILVTTWENKASTHSLCQITPGRNLTLTKASLLASPAFIGPDLWQLNLKKILYESRLTWERNIWRVSQVIIFHNEFHAGGMMLMLFITITHFTRNRYFNGMPRWKANFIVFYRSWIVFIVWVWRNMFV